MVARARWLGWFAPVLPAMVLFCAPSDLPGWVFMWLLTGAIYFAFKLLTFSTADIGTAPLWRQWAYVFVWPGFNARRFLSVSSRPPPPRAWEWFEGGINLIAGAILFWSANRWIGSSSLVVAGWAGMVGTVLMLHFGSFHLVSCFWRSIGVDAAPLMNHPTRSMSVTDFWGRRWNTAFRDITHQFLFRPLAARVGATAALVIGFLFSGLLHELVITVPARGGFGGPTIFFCVQAAAIVFERSPLGKSIGLGRGWRGWLFAVSVLSLPVRLLFPDMFVLKVAVPFMDALGAA